MSTNSNFFRAVVTLCVVVVITILVDIFVVSAKNIVNKYRFSEKIENIIATNNTSDVTETDVPAINEKIENTIFSEEQVPAWLGSPVSAKYSSVQKHKGEALMDMVVFKFEHGVIMAPNGVIDMNLVYAFDEDTANQQGVDHCLKKHSFSAVWTGSKWAPASVFPMGSSWFYGGKDSSWDHCMDDAEYFIIYRHPTPKSQSYNINGNKITIKYCKGNKSDTMNTELVFTVL